MIYYIRNEKSVPRDGLTDHIVCWEYEKVGKKRIAQKSNNKQIYPPRLLAHHLIPSFKNVQCNTKT